MTETTRRRLLLGLGTATTVALAGCSGSDGDDGGDGGDGDDGGDGGMDTTEGEMDTTEGGMDGGMTDDVPAAIDEFLSGANGYDGQILDATGQDSVTVEVGAGDGLAFAPAAVRIDSSTTVEWQWVGGSHNVVSTGESESDFDSGDPTDDTDTTFSQSFDNTGVQLYVCEVHEAGGMLGAIEVV